MTEHGSDVVRALGERILAALATRTPCVAHGTAWVVHVREAVGMSVLIDVSLAHFWDITAVAALDKVVQRFKSHDIAVEVFGLNAASSTLIERLDKSAVLGEV